MNDNRRLCNTMYRKVANSFISFRAIRVYRFKLHARIFAPFDEIRTHFIQPSKNFFHDFKNITNLCVGWYVLFPGFCLLQIIPFYGANLIIVRTGAFSQVDVHEMMRSHLLGVGCVQVICPINFLYDEYKWCY